MTGVRWGVGIAIVIVGLAAAVGWMEGGRSRVEGGARATLSPVAALAGADTTGFARAFEPVPFRFPDDHGPHPDFRTEWWYLTGNVTSAEGRPFGFQLTFFRNALAPEAAGRASQWDTSQLWMAHFALSDVEGGSHLSGERFARGAAGLAGGQADPFRVWLGDWELRGEEGDAFPMLLSASQDGVRLELRAEPVRPPVLQGDRGLSRKGPEPGNASYYLSWTRLELQGEVEIAGRVHNVLGTGWMDREWSTSALGGEHVGWDWFSLQLDDGRDLMFFELRRADGATDPLNHGSLVAPDGESRPLATFEVELEVLDRWTSPLDGTRYPSRWRVRIPSEGMDLTVTPRMRNQEMDLTFRYWEGAVTVEGMVAGDPIGGVGYVELTGYAEGTAPPR